MFHLKVPIRDYLRKTDPKEFLKSHSGKCIKDEIRLNTHYLKGNLFENYIILELLKNRINQGMQSNLYF